MATKRQSVRIARGAALGALALGALYSVGVGLVLPPIARHLAQERLSEALGRSVTIDRVRMNPFTLAASVEGLRVFEPDAKTVFASFDALDLEASPKSLRHLAPVFNAATLRGLSVKLVREGDTRYNVTDIVERLAAPAGGSGRTAFSFSNIHVAGGRVELDDRPLGARHEMDRIDIAIPFVSSLPVHARELVKPAFSARINGAALRLEGETLPFEPSLPTHLAVEWKGIDLKRYAPYSPAPLPVTLDSGTLDARITLRFENAKASGPAFRVAGVATLRDFAASTAAGPAARADQVDLELAELRPLARTLKLAAVRAKGLQGLEDRIALATAEAREIDVDLRARTLKVGGLAIAGGTVRAARASGGHFRLAALPADPAAAPAAPWHVSLGRLEVADVRVRFDDLAVRPAVHHVVGISALEGSDLSTEKGGSGKVTAKLAFEGGGVLDVASTFALEPFMVESRIDAHGIDLAPLRPYVSQFPTVAVRKARAFAKGSIKARGEGRGLRVGYAGAAGIEDLAAFETASREELLRWKAVAARDLRLDWGPAAPLDVAIGEVAVDRAYSRIIVYPDGKLNVQQLRFAETSEAPGTTRAAAGPVPRIRIDRIAFRDSRLDFTDHYVKPNYRADVGELEGTVTGLSSDPASRGTVELRGRYDRTSPVVIAGTLNPLAPELFIDIAAKGADIELPKLTAYSQRYAGYGIREGRLSLDVHYRLENGKLEGRNKILLEQLAFGEKVESAEAIQLPILLAVNLLKDADGKIDLELPVSGSLDDPQFEISGLVGQVVMSLLKKLVTNPFAVLAAVFSGGEKGTSSASGAAAASAATAAGGEDLAYVEFAPGAAEIAPMARGKLERLAKALTERPGLRLEIASRLDAERELRALRFAALRREVIEAKRREMGGRGGEVAVEDPEYPRLVRAAYAAAKLPDGEQLSVAEMESRLMARAAIDEATMQKLALERAERVMGYLTGDGKLASDRVQLAASAEPAGSGTPASRVVFSLR